MHDALGLVGQSHRCTTEAPCRQKCAENAAAIAAFPTHAPAAAAAAAAAASSATAAAAWTTPAAAAQYTSEVSACVSAVRSGQADEVNFQTMICKAGHGLSLLLEAQVAGSTHR